MPPDPTASHPGESRAQTATAALAVGAPSDAGSLQLAAESLVVLDHPNVHGEEDRALLAGAVAHELRTTLSLISGYSQSLLHLALDDETRRRYLERILAETDTLTEFADQIVELSLAGDPRPALNTRPVGVEWLVGRLMRQMAGAADGATVRYQSPRQLPLVDVDPTWIGHVLRSLVANALKHGAASPGHVTIRARPENGFVVVTVEDDGRGFERDERELVFDAFYRGRRARADGTDGAGLGLYLCRHIIEGHGGRIWIDDALRGGSVSFRLPRHRPLRGVAQRPGDVELERPGRELEAVAGD